MARIPKVRTWTVRMDDGAKFEVTGPTRLLARLNFVHGILDGVSGYRRIIDHGGIDNVYPKINCKVRGRRNV